MSARLPWMTKQSLFRVRSAVPGDHDRVEHFLAAMDRDGLYKRHFAYGEAPNLALLQRLKTVDHHSRVAVLTLDHNGEVVGHAEYVTEHDRAEFALMVLPQVRARGIGKRMLLALLDIAMAAGQRGMHGMIQATNGGAIKVALECGFQVVPGDDRAVVIVSREIDAPNLTDSPANSRPGRAVTAPKSETIIRHDPDRTSLHRRFGSRAPLRAGGG